jgi:hypothetical protein
MGTWKIAVLGFVLVLGFSLPCRAAESQDEVLKKIEALEQQLRDLKELQRAGTERKAQCLKAVGQEKFCACVAEGLPAGVGFEGYVHTVVTPKEPLGYEAMNPEQKRVVDQTLAVREKCVAKEKGGLLW